MCSLTRDIRWLCMYLNLRAGPEDHPASVQPDEVGVGTATVL